METSHGGSGSPYVGALKNFLRGMETPQVLPWRAYHDPSKTSLEGWKLGWMCEVNHAGDDLKNFLRGMETQKQGVACQNQRPPQKLP